MADCLCQVEALVTLTKQGRDDSQIHQQTSDMAKGNMSSVKRKLPCQAPANAQKVQRKLTNFLKASSTKREQSAKSESSVASEPIPSDPINPVRSAPVVRAPVSSAPATTAAVTNSRHPTGSELQARPPVISRPRLPYLNFTDYGRIQFSTSAAEVEDLCSVLLRKGLKEIGWDIEWRTTYKSGEPPRKTALMQLCYQTPAGSYCCLLIHVFSCGLPPSLRQILCDPGIAKAGVCARADAYKVGRDFGLELQGIAELTDHAIVRADENLTSRSLISLTERYMQCTLQKETVRTSNWESRVLSYEQQLYAATDAFASLRLYQILQAMPLPEAAPQTTAGDANYITSLANKAAMIAIPQLASTKALQPAKKTVYIMLILKGLSLEEVARQRKIQVTTVASYLAEAIIGGYTYFWPAFNLSDAELAALQICANRLLINNGGMSRQEVDMARDIVYELHLSGIGIRAFQEQVSIPMDFGKVRIGLAHLARMTMHESSKANL